jgi:hypothetical protein
MRYPNGSMHAVKIPYAAWTSARIFALVVDNLLRNVMGYATELVVFEGKDADVVSATAGCRDFTDFECKEHDIFNPGIHFSLESWTDGINRASSLPSELRPELISILDYNLDDGYFLWKEVVTDGLNTPNHLNLATHYSYDAKFHKPHAHFDSWEKLYQLLPESSVVKCTDIFSEIGLMYSSSVSKGNLALQKYIRLTNDTTFACGNNDTVWFSPACRANTTECVPLVLLYNFDWAMQRATLLNLPFAIMLVNSWTTGDYEAFIQAIKTGRFLFHWTKPDDSLFDSGGELPVLFELPRMNVHEHAQDLHVSGLDSLKGRNYAWQLLAQVDPFVAHFARHANFNDDDMRAMMLRSRALNHSIRGTAALQEVACEWVRANEPVWRRWVPALCPGGAHADPTLTACLPCPSGSFCPGGTAAPRLCPAGSYCPGNCSAPMLCPPASPFSIDGATSGQGCSVCRSGNTALAGRCFTTPELLSVVIVSAAAVCTAVVAALLWCRGTDREAREMSGVVRKLRERLHIRRADGYFLGAERGPLFAGREGVVHVQQAAIDAAARLARLRDDFDGKHLDVFCAALQGPEQQARLRAWLLEVCYALLDPAEHFADALESLALGHDGTSDGRRIRKSSLSLSLRRLSESIDRRRLRSDTSCITLLDATQEERFQFFRSKLARLRVWSDCGGALFRELQAGLQAHIERIARLCDRRFLELVSGTDGDALADYGKGGQDWGSVFCMSGGRCEAELVLRESEGPEDGELRPGSRNLRLARQDDDEVRRTVRPGWSLAKLPA